MCNLEFEGDKSVEIMWLNRVGAIINMGGKASWRKEHHSNNNLESKDETTNLQLCKDNMEAMVITKMQLMPPKEMGRNIVDELKPLMDHSRTFGVQVDHKFKIKMSQKIMECENVGKGGNNIDII
jgi:hypothetical protein